jgi:hypothetical protein
MPKWNSMQGVSLGLLEAEKVKGKLYLYLPKERNCSIFHYYRQQLLWMMQNRILFLKEKHHLFMGFNGTLIPFGVIYR